MQPEYREGSSSNYDGRRFYNSTPSKKSVLEMAKFMTTFWLRKEQWPDYVKNGQYPSRPVNVDGIVVTYINHSTVLISVSGVNILTDPIWSERASPFTAFGPKRIREPGLSIEELPHIDVILISHNHYDHLDLTTLKKLRDKGRKGEQPLILVGLGVGKLLKKNEFQSFRELDWNDSADVRGLEITFVEVRHRSGRGLTDQMRTLWGGFVIESEVGPIYFAGDTGYGPHFVETHEKFGNFQLSLIPIGAYRPRSFMAPVHIDPAQAVQAHRDLKSQKSIAIHHGSFQLTYEPIGEPYAELSSALEKQNVEKNEFRVLGFGESITIDRVSQSAK